MKLWRWGRSKPAGPEDLTEDEVVQLLRDTFDRDDAIQIPEPPAWVTEWEGDVDELLPHADEIGDDHRLADGLFVSKGEAFDAGRYIGGQL